MASFSVSSQLDHMWWLTDGPDSRLGHRDVYVFFQRDRIHWIILTGCQSDDPLSSKCLGLPHYCCGSCPAKNVCDRAAFRRRIATTNISFSFQPRCTRKLLGLKYKIKMILIYYTDNNISKGVNASTLRRIHCWFLHSKIKRCEKKAKTPDVRDLFSDHGGGRELPLVSRD